MATANSPSPAPTPFPRWHWIYYILAIFDVCTVALSLWLNYRIVTSYTDSINENGRWIEVLDHAAEVNRLSLAIDAPINDIFESRDLTGEVGRMQIASRQFDEEVETVRGLLHGLPTNSEGETLTTDLRNAAKAKADMLKQSERLFARIGENKRDEAIKSMVAIDRTNAHILALMNHFRGVVRTLEQESFRHQSAAAVWLQRWGGLVALLMLGMVMGATYWGFRLAQRAAEDVGRSEAYKREMEQRVALRTQELQRSFKQHGDLIRQLITAQEDERARIARDLHDEIGQSLTSLILGLRTLDDAADLKQVHAEVGELRRTAIQAADEIRRLARGLRPAVLDDLGLHAAVERLASDAHQNHGLIVTWNSQGPVSPRLPKTVETALYRIIQEAINNIVKHARASNVWIDLERAPDKVSVLIADDGRGITPDVLTKAHQNGRMGVTGMKERATLLGGSVNFIRRGAGGTAVQVVLPLDGHGAA